MPELRPPARDELQAASDLCLRSKSYWGYDAAFMAACVAELMLSDDDLAETKVVPAISDGALAGAAQVSLAEDGCFLEKLFVDPPFIGRGIGRALFDWSRSTAAELGARAMIVEADPDAVPFYEAMGCMPAGTAPAGSISGRRLPRLVHPLEAPPGHGAGTET